MTDVRKASDTKLIRLLCTFGPSNAQQPGTLSPDPWHFSLFASSMVQEQGDAAPRSASSMPLDCCPLATRAHARGRGACQQSPILRSSNTRLPARLAVSKGQVEHLYHAIGPKRQMPGVWGQSPQEPASTQRPDEPDVMRDGRQEVAYSVRCSRDR
jgi:hypothetical protein